MAKSTLIGSLKISLLAVTKGFDKGMGRASRSVKKFNRLLRTNMSTALGLAAGKLLSFGARGLASIPRLVGSAIKALAKLVKMLAITLVAAAAAAGVALALLTKNSLKDLDRLAKSSRIIGLTVNELKALELAASEAGVENKVLEKSLRNMTRQVNDAAKGTGEAVDALNDLGINAKKLAAQSIPEQFMAIADALAEVKDKGERIQLAFDLFGGRGLSLLNLSATAIRNAGDELERMGLLISDIDSKKIEQFNDSVGDLKRAFKGVGDQIAIRLAPILGGVVAKMIALIEGLGGIDTIVGSALTALKPKILAFANNFAQAGIFIATRLSAAFDVIAGSMDELGGKSLTVKNTIQNGFGQAARVARLAFLVLKIIVIGAMAVIVKGIDLMVDGVVASLNFLREPLQAASDFFDLGFDFSPIIRNADNQMSAIADSLVAQTAEIAADIAKTWDSALTGALDDPGTAITGVDDLIKRTGDKIASLTKTGAESFANLTASINKALIEAPADERVSTLLERLRVASESLGGAVRQVNEDYEKAQDSADNFISETIKGTNKLGQTIDQAADGIASSLAKGESAFESLRSVALSVIDDIAKAFIKSQIFGFLGSLFTGGGVIGTAIGGLTGSSAAALAAPSSLIPASAGGGDININFFGPTSGDDAIREQVALGIAEAQPQLTNAAVAAVADRKQRNPNFLRSP